MSENKKSINPLALVLLLSGAFFLVFLLISGVLVSMKSSSGGGRAGVGKSWIAGLSGGAVGVVEVTGVIMDSKKTLKQLKRFEDDDAIKAVVLRLNSPGGSVAPSQEIYEAVKAYSKPLVASMGSVAASGAYYIACGASKVFANPGTLTGSIGVIMPFANLQKLYEWAKIQRYSIKTGRYKDAGADYREMAPDEKALLQAMLDDVLMQFKKAVADGRHLSMEKVTEVADGRIFSGQQAFQRKLVDELGTLQDAIEEAATLGKIKGKPLVFYPEKKRRSILDFLVDDSGLDDESSESKTHLSTGVMGVVDRFQSLLQGQLPSEHHTLSLEPGLYWLWQ